MKTVLARTTVLLALVLLGQLSLSEFGALRLVARPLKQVLVLGEPLTVSVRLENPTSSDALVHRAFQPELGFVGVTVLEVASGVTYHIRGPEWGTESVTLRALRLAPGHGIDGTVTILMNEARRNPSVPRDYLAFPAPGEFRVTFTLTALDGKTRLTAESFTVRVVEPEAEELAVFGVLDNEGMALFLETGFTTNQGVRDGVAGLVAKFPRSVYAPYLVRALGQMQ